MNVRSLPLPDYSQGMTAAAGRPRVSLRDNDIGANFDVALVDSTHLNSQTDTSVHKATTPERSWAQPNNVSSVTIGSPSISGRLADLEFRDQMGQVAKEAGPSTPDIEPTSFQPGSSTEREPEQTEANVSPDDLAGPLVEATTSSLPRLVPDVQSQHASGQPFWVDRNDDGEHRSVEGLSGIPASRGGTQQGLVEVVTPMNLANVSGDNVLAAVAQKAELEMTTAILRSPVVHLQSIESHIRTFSMGSQRATGPWGIGSIVTDQTPHPPMTTQPPASESEIAPLAEEPASVLSGEAEMISSQREASRADAEPGDEMPPQQQIAQLIRNWANQQASQKTFMNLPSRDVGFSAERELVPVLETVKSMRIVLRPAELGQVDVRMTINHGTVRLHLNFEREGSAAILRADKRGLEDALAAAGLAVDGVVIVSDRTMTTSTVNANHQDFTSGPDSRDTGANSSHDPRQGRPTGARPAESEVERNETEAAATVTAMRARMLVV